MLAAVQERGYATAKVWLRQGATWLGGALLQGAVRGGGGLVQSIRASYSLTDLSQSLEWSRGRFTDLGEAEIAASPVASPAPGRRGLPERVLSCESLSSGYNTDLYLPVQTDSLDTGDYELWERRRAGVPARSRPVRSRSQLAARSRATLAQVQAGQFSGRGSALSVASLVGVAPHSVLICFRLRCRMRRRRRGRGDGSPGARLHHAHPALPSFPLPTLPTAQANQTGSQQRPTARRRLPRPGSASSDSPCRSCRWPPGVSTCASVRSPTPRLNLLLTCPPLSPLQHQLLPPGSARWRRRPDQVLLHLSVPQSPLTRSHHSLTSPA